jgi:hypothetical protein
MSEKLTLEERLNDELNEKEAKIAELEEQIENAKYQEDWKWRHIRKLTKAENMGLPTPRLEIRYKREDDYNVIADYGLVYEHFDGEVLFNPFGSTRMGGYSNKKNDEPLRLPFRDGAHLQHDMWMLKLRGYVVNGTEYREVTLDDRDDLPGGLLRKMDKAKGKEQ